MKPLNINPVKPGTDYWLGYSRSDTDSLFKLPQKILRNSISFYLVLLGFLR